MRCCVLGWVPGLYAHPFYLHIQRRREDMWRQNWRTECDQMVMGVGETMRLHVQILPDLSLWPSSCTGVGDVSGVKEWEASMEVSSLALEGAGCLHLWFMLENMRPGGSRGIRYDFPSLVEVYHFPLQDWDLQRTWNNSSILNSLPLKHSMEENLLSKIKMLIPSGRWFSVERACGVSVRTWV